MAEHKSNKENPWSKERILDTLKLRFTQNSVFAVAFNLFMIGLTGLLAAFFFFNVWLPAITLHNETITVPDLKGRHLDEVPEIVKKRDLRYTVLDTAYDPNAKPMTVLKQNPPRDAKVKVDRNIYLTVNAVNPPKVAVPDIIEGSNKSALLKIKAAKLQVGKREYIAHPDRNAVIRIEIDGKEISKEQIREGYKVAQGTEIDLFIGDGGTTGSQISLPNLIGRPLEEAEFYAQGIGLKVGKIHYVKDPDAEPGRVVQQKPAPVKDAKIKVGEVIELWVAEFYSEGEEEDK